MLGLRRHHVTLVPHDERWFGVFEEVAEELVRATGLPRARIQHVGSTAVRGLPAKPILDVDVGRLESESADELAAALTRAGFLDRGGKPGGIGRLVVREAGADVRTVHVHIIPHQSVWWRCDLAFRDALRSDPLVRERYAEIKAKLAERFPNDRASYREGKAPFIRRVLYELDPTGWRAEHGARTRGT